MARMSREFKLVLLGAGLLTTGSFLWRDEDPLKRADEEAGNGGNGSRGRYRTGGIFIFTSYTRTTTTPAAVSSSTSRGGFGRIGGVFSGS